MAPMDQVALRLRFRERHHSAQPPDIESFRRPAAPADVAGQARRTAPIGVVRGRRPQAPHAPLVIFFQYASHGIPALGQGTERPDPSSWSIRPTVFGYLASVPRSRRTSSRSPVTWVVAACLPLVLPGPALAAPRGDAPVQRPAVPELPGSDDGAVAGEGEAEPDEPSEVEASPAPSEPEDPAGLVDPMVDVTDGALTGPTEALSSTDAAVLDAAWEGVDGFDVELELKGHQTMRGRVGAVQRDTFTLIQSGTGAVLVLPKSGVSSLRVRVPPALPAKNGAGLLIGGSILTSVGTPVFISGLTFLGICPSCAYLHLPMLLIGGGALAGGIPMLIRGTQQRRVYREALEQRDMSVAVLRTRYGWTGGLRFRF